MSKVITFSRTFPSYHPKAGQPTMFIEKIYASLADTQPKFKIPNDANSLWDWHEYYNCLTPKHHTVRAGHRWKVGDWFSPRVWSGKPYQSHMIQLAMDIQIKKVWDISRVGYDWTIPGNAKIKDIAKNDGLETLDFLDWLQLSGEKEFDGQIVCWNELIEY